MIGRLVRLEEADGWERRGCVGVLVRDEEAEAESEGLLLCCWGAVEAVGAGETITHLELNPPSTCLFGDKSREEK